MGSLIPDPAIKELLWAAWQGFERGLSCPATIKLKVR